MTADKVARVRDHAAARSHVLFTYTAADGFSVFMPNI